MSLFDEGGYTKVRRYVAVGAMALVLGGLSLGSALADGTYGEPESIPSGSGYGAADYGFDSSTVAVPYGTGLYQYATGTDGAGYYATYDGSAWSDWATWSEQPVEYGWEPTAVTYKDATYVYYTGTDNKLYGNSYNGTEWAGWQDLAGDYGIKCAPYVNVNGDWQYLYATAADGSIIHKGYDGTTWGEWQKVSGDIGSDYEPYAVSWGGYEQVFWQGTDGYVYWSRYDGTSWSEAKALPGDYQLDSAPYAVGYAPEEKLYAYAVTTDGKPAWNVFTEGEGWTGWKPYDGLTVTVTNQPNAYVYDDVQHLVFTGTDGHAYATEYDGGWSDEWVDLGANYAYDPYQYEYNDELYLTYTGSDGNPYYKVYAGGDTDSGY